MSVDVREREFLWGEELRIDRAVRKLRLGGDDRPHLVDATMLYAPRSGGVKRYLSAKRAWLKHARPGVRETLVVPGAKSMADGDDIVTIKAAKLPFGDGYRWPSNLRKWSNWMVSLRPSIIEAGDPYTPGQAAIEAGQRLGVPVVGFCHSDPAALAALHFGEWAKKPVQKRWAKVFSEFDQVVAPSRFIASRLNEAGIENVACRPLGVDVDTFRPDRRDRAWLLKKLGLSSDARLLVFAGRPAREKNVDGLVQAVQRLGAPYHLLLIGAGAGLPPEDRVIPMDYERDPKALARLIGSCDAFVHANENEPFGLIVLEAMACGLPVVGVSRGGVSETVDNTVGQLAKTSDPRDFAEAVDALFGRDREALSLAARERAMERFAWDRVFTDLSALYAQVARAPAFADDSQALPVH
ncbi:MAG: glycosyltransferase [Proteobacteria bacterium]|nr:glycosyltransferase [Pseudomonadota bacterium]